MEYIKLQVQIKKIQVNVFKTNVLHFSRSNDKKGAVENCDTTKFITGCNVPM